MSSKSLQTTMVQAGIHSLDEMPDYVSVPKVPPIYMSSVFSFDDVPSLDAVYAKEAPGYVYSRDGNPGTDYTADMIAQTEGGECALVFSSGMAAILQSIIAFIGQGDHVVSSPVLYGGVYNYLKNEAPRFGVETTFVDFTDLAAVEAAIKPNTKVVYTETITNPLMEVFDLEAIAKIAHKHGCKFIVDNTFASGAICKPLELGADIVANSSTKFMGGHSDVTGGSVVTSPENWAPIKRGLAMYGPIMSPFDAWLMARSLRTMDMRVARHSENALKVAQFLENHPKIEKVHYPGLERSPYHALAMKMFYKGRCGGMLSADIPGGEKGASDFIKNLKHIKFVPSLASYTTSLSYPAKTSHRAYNEEELKAAGITMGTLRFSIGLEEPEDIIEEFDAALAKL